MTAVFHGTANFNLKKFVQRTDSPSPRLLGRLLYVTDTFERAARYANAQATETVRSDAFELGEGAAVIELRAADDVKWHFRPENHNTLDQCEATITTWEIVSITINPTRYWNTRANREDIPALIARFGDKIKLLSPLPIKPNS